MKQLFGCDLFQRIGNRQRFEITRYDRFQISIKFGERSRSPFFVTTKNLLQAFFESRLDKIRRPRVSFLEALALLRHFVSKRFKLCSDFIERSCTIINATKLGLEVAAEDADEDFTAKV